MDYTFTISDSLYSLFLIRAGQKNPSADEELYFKSLLQEAQQEACDYCRVDILPESVNSIIVNMTLIKYNRQGTEGLDSHSYSGISEKFNADYPEIIYRSLRKYRKAKIC